MRDPSCNEPEVALSDDDVFEAMKAIPGYLDITPADFREIYLQAFRHACRRIAASVLARHIMTTPVETVRTDTPLQAVADLMAQKGIAGLPVLSPDGLVAGVISEKDFLRRLGAHPASTFMGIVSDCLRADGCIAVAIRGRTAQDIMTSPAITVPLDATIGRITDICNRSGFNRVPVLDDEGRLAGIVTRADIIRGAISPQRRA
jgi:CBS-domain-containing membrane protein